MNKIYTYISRKTIKSTIGRFLAGSFGHHPKTALLFVCLAFFAISAPAQAQVTLSGTIYSDAGTTPDATSRAIRVAVGTSTPGVFASSSMTTSGAYTVTIGAGNGIATGTPIMVWIDGGAVLGSVVTKASSTFSGANITGLDIYRNRLITRHEATSATSTTINDLSFYTIGQDADVTHATTSNGEIVVRSGVELYVWSGDTFAPGGAVTVAGNGGAGATEGSMTMAASSVYTAGGNLRLAGSLSVPSTATFNAGSSTIFFVASTTGKTISAPVTSIGNVTFVGNGGGWAFTSSATTSDFTILVGSVTAPSTALAVRGTYQNYGTFDNNGGKMTIIGAPTIPTGNFPAYTAGLDASGSAAGTGNLQINHLAVSGNGRTLYAAKAGSATACSQTAGSAIGCELIVIDIANTSAPAYVAGRDVSGNSAGTGNLAINYLTVVGNYLYVAKAGSATACSQTAGSAIGCELMVFDISSTTNPVYVAGRDMDGTATGVQNIAAQSLAAKGTSLYVAKAASGATACSTTALNCELMVFDISSTTNPTYQTGRDTSGSAGGTQTLAINSVSVVGDLLLAGKAGSATACSQSAGSAVGCELMVFDVASTTNPTYLSGRDVSGSAAGTGNLAITFVTGTGTIVYVAKAANATACSQTAGSALGCEIMAFDLTSSTSPLYVRGVDVSGSETGQQSGQVSHLHLAGNYLYANTAASASICKQSNGLSIGCELVVFDVSSSTALRHITGRDVSGSVNGVQSIAHKAAVSVGNMLFVSRGGSATACSQTAGSTGAAACELAAFSLTNIPQGILMGSLTGSNALGAVVATGTVEFRDNATTSDLTVAVGTTTLPSLITVTGDFQNDANLVSPETTLKLDSSFAQSIGGNLVGTNELYTLHLSGNGSKTFSSNASTTFFTIDTGVSVTFPSLLSVSDTYTNSGTVDAGSGTLNTDGYVGGFLSGVSAGGSLTDAGSTNINSLVRVGSFVFAAKSNSNTACSQTAGSAVGCELMVFNIESQTAPSYRAGRDGSGNAAGTGNITTNHLAVSSNNQTLYVAKGGDATACSQTAGSAVGCELMVFDIASSTNPTYVAGRDANGNTVGTGNVAINYLLVSGNYLYVAKAGSATACTQSSSTASGCELMVFDISSTTNPVFVASRDMDGTTTGVQNIAALSLAASGTSLYVAKAASGGTACSTTALNCELMVFDISSTTNPTYQTGRDASGSAGGTQTLAINTLTIMGNALVAGKAGSATACSQSAGSAVGCELMVFDISSTTNPTYISGQDVSGSAAGTGNLAITFVTSTGTIAYVGKAANVTNCSQDAGAGIGCELMAFDISSTTNPLYVRGLDASLETNGDLSLGIQTVLAATSSLLVGKLASALPCEQLWNLRTGCELLQLKMPTTMNGTMTGASRLNNLTTLGLTEITTNASTSDLTIASSSIFTAPSTTLSLSGNFLRAGEFRSNQGTVALIGTNQTLNAPATTTFYNLTQRATTTATTTFGTTGGWQINNSLTLAGSGAEQLALRSVTDGVQWTLLPLGSTSVSYVNVKDSRNSSTTFLSCLTGCTDAGNNTGWSWPAAPENVWNANDWVLYDTLTISEANIRSDLTDFPVYVNLDDLSPIFWATTPTSSALAGTDIRVTTEADVEVPRELVFASTTTQKGELHFKAPYLSSTTDTVFKIWYNGTTSGDYAPNATYGAQNVWTNNYLGVYHLDNDPSAGAGAITDSTSNARHGTAGGGVSSADKVTGKLGNSLDFDSGDYVEINSLFGQPAQGTLSTWFELDAVGDIGSELVSLGDSFAIRAGSSGNDTKGFYHYNPDWYETVANTQPTAPYPWKHLAFTNNPSGSSQEIYTNGEADGSTINSSAIVYDLGTTTLFGRHGNGSGFHDLDGRMDEVRIASVVRTSDWLAAEYANQSTTTNFYGVLKNWNAADWTSFETITIDESNIDEDLTDFPVYVNLANLSNNFWSTTPASAARVGTDIRVTTADNIEVPRELVFASSTLQTGELHFKAPLVSATSDTVFKIWYNGSTAGDYADTATYGAQNVWTNNYFAVYHMQQDPTGTTTDSTSNNYDAFPRGGSFSSNALVPGAVGSAVNFNGSDAVDATNFTSHLSSFAVESWVRPTDLQNTGNLYTIIDLKDALYWAIRDTDDSLRFGTNWGSYYNWTSVANTVRDDVFQHVYTEIDNLANTSSDPDMFNNTITLSRNDNTPTGTHTQSTSNLYIGGAFGFDPFVGDIDELRISSTTRSETWRRATYINQATTTDFYTVNESVGSSTLTVHSAGQVGNAFSSANKTNESLFAFRLQPNTGTTTVTQIIFSLSGVVGVSSTDFTNIRLLRDLDSDGQYDAGDVAVGGAGIISLLDQAGTITFDGDFLSTTTQDYIVVADWNAPANGSFITINLYRENITIINGTVETIPVVSGTTGSPTTTSNVTYQGMTGTTYQWGTSGGTITFSGAGTVYPLIVAGGGAGGVGNLFERGGGGGAGGMVGGYPSHPNYSFPATASSYTINVGVGGVPSTTSAGPGTNGSNSSIVGTNAPPAAIGGGGGGTQNDGEFGQDGGSGGGGTFSFAAGNGTTSQGNSGSLGIFGSVYGGGGGGAGQRGEAQKVADQQLAGGAGLSSTITGTLVYYAGGGGGTIDNDGRNGEAGGIGGGGSAAGLTYAARSGTDGLGGGGAPGTTGTSDSHRAGKGGDGTVILFVPSVIPVVQQQISGSVTFVQHSRNNKGGGGSGASIGDPAPAGDGDVGGGGDTGGEVIGNDPDYFWPSSHSGSWTNGASAYDQTDGTYATTNSGANHQYADHSLVVPGSNTIQGIIIKLELSGTTGAGTVDVQLSWDGGSSWTSAKSTPTLSTTDAVYTLGSPSDLWGRSWSTSDFSNANFRIRVIGNVSSNTIRLDAVQVRVYHTAGGGGGGGGGAI